ncbi:MAG: DUF2274 domain-containing protein [Deltaproteobacteria bacterium]|nr:DUF2274 domain-containing protein [Deltaproteobacteria bacterium]
MSLGTLHGRTHGQAVNTVTLIPHMLEVFMLRGQGFKKARI